MKLSEVTLKKTHLIFEDETDTRTPEVGTTTESISAQTEGDDLTLSFNQRYVSEPLSHIAGDSIVMHFAGLGRPLVISGVNDVSLRYLVMPMNK